MSARLRVSRNADGARCAVSFLDEELLAHYDAEFIAVSNPIRDSRTWRLVQLPVRTGKLDFDGARVDEEGAP